MSADKQRVKINGDGIVKLCNGDVYDGKWANGVREGKGKYIWANGEEFEGNWVDDKINGDGKKKYLNGRVYEGKWKNGEREGKGILIFENKKDIIEGYWSKNILQNPVKILYSNGDVYTREINEENLQRQGKGVLIEENGDKYDGNWVNDQRHGAGKETFKAGKCVYEGVWENGKFLEK